MYVRNTYTCAFSSQSALPLMFSAAGAVTTAFPLRAAAVVAVRPSGRRRAKRRWGVRSAPRRAVAPATGAAARGRDMATGRSLTASLLSTAEE